MLRAVRTPIYALSVRECSVTETPVHASEKGRRNERASDDPQVPLSELQGKFETFSKEIAVLW